MPDLPDLSTVAGEELTPEQIRGILNQIDLDITNLVRDGKLAAVKYSIPGAAGQATDRATNVQGLLAARQYYQSLLASQPSWNTTQAELE